MIYICFSKHVFEVPMAYCLSQERNPSAVASACPTTCEKEKERLTCASDGNIYRNDCEMKMLNCGYVLLNIQKHITNAKYQ